jgi:uncharacterized protein YbbC (DUF1343 family)
VKTAAVRTGSDLLPEKIPAYLLGCKVGAVVHPPSVDVACRQTVDLLLAGGVDLRCLFGPQHGLRGETQDNMIEWEGFIDPRLGLPAYSLYGEYRKPAPAMLEDIDVLLFDLQDVGARYYTFVWTLLLCMEACAEAGKRVVVLDRPNPLGGEILEGSVLDPEYKSFVGLAPIPMRHGLTVGEMARYFRDNFALDLELDVVAMSGWKRDMFFARTGLPWIMPSPNMPTPDTALVYPGMCLLEGTSLSEGRGTTRPFEIFGAPGIEPHTLCDRLNGESPPGVFFRPLHFEPTFQKHAGTLCGGAQFHVTDPAVFRSTTAVLGILAAVRDLFPEALRWNDPPYEYETEKLPIDILAGGPDLRLTLDAGGDPSGLIKAWAPALEEFQDAREIHLLYD